MLILQMTKRYLSCCFFFFFFFCFVLFFFSRKQNVTFHANLRQFALNVKTCFFFLLLLLFCMSSAENFARSAVL